MILADTSVWIAVFRAQAPLDLESLVDFDDVVTCLPVIQEVLQGFKNERAFRIARDSMLALPRVESPLSETVVLEAVELYRRARRAGRTLRSSVDCLIATCALRHDLELIHRDRDYGSIALVVPLRQREV